MALAAIIDEHKAIPAICGIAGTVSVPCECGRGMLGCSPPLWLECPTRCARCPEHDQVFGSDIDIVARVKAARAGNVQF